MAEILDLSHPARKPASAGVRSAMGSAVGWLVRPLVHVGRRLVVLVVGLRADDGGHDTADDDRMPVHVFLASRLTHG